MSQYYRGKRVRNLFDPSSKKPFRLSRSKIDLFLECPRCFYIDRRLGLDRPPGYPFSLNSAVDALLKKEFDIHRTNGTCHPMIKTYGIDLIPFQHPQINEWRNALQGGIVFHHKETNLIITGGIDDVWKNQRGDLHIVDYKATSVDGEVTLEDDWKVSYKRQMEVYQWLFRRNDFKVSNIGYFVYCNGNKDKEAFDGHLEFDVKLIPYEGNDNWVEPTILEAHKCLSSDQIPTANKDCDFCRYALSLTELTAPK